MSVVDNPFREDVSAATKRRWLEIWDTVDTIADARVRGLAADATLDAYTLGFLAGARANNEAARA